jgi:tetratricopeptide (TPR) repeat protein
MNRSLTPLIVLFALIILFTIILINSQSAKKEIDYEKSGLIPEMKLSPFHRRVHREKSNPQPHVLASDVIPDINLMLIKARRAMEADKYREAEEELRTLLVFYPDNFTALSLLGKIFYDSQRYPEATAIFKKQLKLKPADTTVYNNLGSSLAKQGKFQEAIENTSKALEIEPENTTACLNLAGMYSVMENTDSSVEYFMKAYDQMGEQVIPMTYDPTLENIRQHPEIQKIIEKHSPFKKIEKKTSPPDSAK